MYFMIDVFYPICKLKPDSRICYVLQKVNASFFVIVVLTRSVQLFRWLWQRVHVYTISFEVTPLGALRRPGKSARRRSTSLDRMY
jgi:hypothetical protein